MTTKMVLQTWGFALLALLLFAACGDSGNNGDSTPPTVISNTPPGGASDVPMNATIRVTFSEAMDPQTISTSTFTVYDGITPVTGTVTYAEVTATFTPNADLDFDTQYTATITSGAEDLAGNALAADYEWTFTTGVDVDTAPPEVDSTVPTNLETEVAINAAITASFNEAMDPTTISDSTFTVYDGITHVTGTVTYAGVTATFTPNVDLDFDTQYTATVTSGAEDLAGNALAADYEWTFTTGVDVDTVPPEVISTLPADLETEVAINASINITFSEAMDPTTISDSTFTVYDGVAPVTGTVTYAGVTATFMPDADLDFETQYTATITSGAEDLAGNALAADYEWTFTTGVDVDTVPPEVISTVPADLETEVPINRSISVTFSEAMDPTTLTTDTFLVSGPDATPVVGAVTCSGTWATFDPSENLALDTLFQVSITTDAKDLGGNALASEFNWSFTTSSDEAFGPDPVLLGRAGDYVILSKSGVDNVPTSAITGDVGVSPIDSTGITGFSLTMDVSNEFSTSDQVTGQVRAADYSPPTPSNLTTAVSDMETAYIDAAGRSTPDFVDLGAGEIGGLTLEPGLYNWGTGVSISTDVTLDGGPNDVWIFQIAGDVTQANGISVVLSGGASPKNIFWQAFGQTMIGTNAHMEGIVLCQTAIILGTGASVNGRLLAQTAVTLDQSVVSQPSM